MNYDTPAFALNYEHKSKGIMEQLGLPESAVDFKEILDDTLFEKISSYLDNYDVNKKSMISLVEIERQRAIKMIENSVNLVQNLNDV